MPIELPTGLIESSAEESLARHRSASARWLSYIKPLLYENWHPTLKELSFKTHIVELSPDDQRALLSASDPKERSEEFVKINSLIHKLDEAIVDFKNLPVFTRLSSRSPKDSFSEDFACKSGKDIINLFSSSMRVIDDLIEYKYADIKCFLLLREFAEIPKHQEWRIFIKGGEIVGVTQYFYHEHFPAIDSSISYTIKRINDFVLPLIPLLPENVVIDIWAKDKPVLIEINPYGLSDPCLLNYDDMDNGNAGIRYIKLQNYDVADALAYMFKGIKNKG